MGLAFQPLKDSTESIVLLSNPLIKVVYETSTPETSSSDLMVQGIAFHNISNNPITVKEVTLTVRSANGESSQSLTYKGKTLKNKIGNAVNTFKKPDSFDKQFTEDFIKLKIGVPFSRSSEDFSDCIFDSDFVVLPNNFLPASLFYFHAPFIIDSLEVSVLTDAGNINKTFPVIEYAAKNKFISPVKTTGLGFFEGYAFGTSHHRITSTQEFAFDLMTFNESKSLFKNTGYKNEDFHCYGLDIMAMADGKVVAFYNSLPENLELNEKFTGKDMLENMQKYSIMAAVAGNYVIIEHEWNEYSVYCHMIPGSVTVKVGDTVKAGDKIGELGNSGNSTAPHLHFHVTTIFDGTPKKQADYFLLGKSIPFEMEDIKDYVTLTPEISDDFLYFISSNPIMKPVE